MGSRNYLYSPGTFSNDINLHKTIAIRERKGLELRASFFNPFNQVRRQDLNISHVYKMNGPIQLSVPGIRFSIPRIGWPRIWSRRIPTPLL